MYNQRLGTLPNVDTGLLHWKQTKEKKIVRELDRKDGDKSDSFVSACT